jgi:hypothetical protein
MQLNFINTLPCKVNVKYAVSDKNGELVLEGNQYEFAQDLEAEQDIIVRAYLESGDCSNFIQLNGFETGEVNLGKGNGTQGYSVLITERDNNLTITRLDNQQDIAFDIICLFESIFSFFLDDRTFEEYSGWNITMLQKIKKKTFEYVYVLNDTAPTTPAVDSIVQTDYQKTEIGS